MVLVMQDINRRTVFSVVVLSIRENEGINLRSEMTKQFYRFGNRWRAQKVLATSSYATIYRSFKFE